MNPELREVRSLFGEIFRFYIFMNLVVQGLRSGGCAA